MAPTWRSPRRKGRFVNWAGTVTSLPSAWRVPRSEDELAALVRSARRIRVVGAGHSWSPIAAPDDVAVSLDHLQGVTIADGVATVRAGTRLGDLCAALDAQGLALPIVGSILHQSIAGAIATGTHGSSLRHGNLASGARVKIIDASGEARELPREARVHLGALGVVTEVSVPVVPAFRLVETCEVVPLARAIAELEAIAGSAEFVKVWWFPHTEAAQIFRYTRTDAKAMPTARAARWIDEVIVNGAVFPAVVAVERARPGWIPAMNRALARVYLDRPARVGASTLMLTVPMPVRHRETEAAVPMTRAAEAFDRVVRAIARDRLAVNMPVELRFVRGDDAWMSPAEGADTCQLGAYAGGVPDVDRYFAAFWRELRGLGARPHWGKELDHEAAELATLFPAMARFQALRDQLDPARIFAGPFHQRILGP